MAVTAEMGDGLFDGGPPLWLHRSLGFIRPRRLRVSTRALCVALIGWAPLAALAAAEALILRRPMSMSFFSDFGAYARYLVALPALIFAVADCLPRLGCIVRHFVEAGIVTGADTVRFQAAVSSTRRLLNSRAAGVLAALLVYALILALLLRIPAAQLPEWYRLGARGFPDFSLAGWWHALVSLPLLLVLVFGWLWRLLLWGRFLALTALLNLQLIPSHPDRAGGLRFVSSSLRGFRLFCFAMGAVVAGAVANRVVHEGAALPAFKSLAIGLILFVLFVCVSPLTVFIVKLRDAKRRGMLEYGEFAGSVGRKFELKWLKQPGRPDPDTLEAPDFSAVIHLDLVAANVYEMRDVPFGTRDLFNVVTATLLPFLPVALLALPLDVIIPRLAKLVL
jgi:hypothetical protein